MNKTKWMTFFSILFTAGLCFSSLAFASIPCDQDVELLINNLQNENNSDDTRWRAMFCLGKATGKESLPLIKRYFNDSNWMLRDAALKTVAALGAAEMRPEIESKLKDNALVIRTTAVD